MYVFFVFFVSQGLFSSSAQFDRVGICSSCNALTKGRIMLLSFIQIVQGCLPLLLVTEAPSFLSCMLEQLRRQIRFLCLTFAVLYFVKKMLRCMQCIFIMFGYGDVGDHISLQFIIHFPLKVLIGSIQLLLLRSHILNILDHFGSIRASAWIPMLSMFIQLIQ